MAVATNVETVVPSTTRLECTEDGASKFWEGSVDGLTFTAKWGRIGTTGQTKAKDFATAEKAAAELAKLVAGLRSTPPSRS